MSAAKKEIRQPAIIPSDLKKKLKKAAQHEANSLWKIADLAAEVMLYVRQEQNKKRLIGVYDFQIWAAIGRACGKSAGRVKKLAAISRAFPPELRKEYEQWEFGYFERAFDMGKPAIDQATGEVGVDLRLQAMEFLEEYANGQLRDGIPRIPIVGEFIPMYRQHILGLGTQEVDMSESLMSVSAVEPPEEPSLWDDLRDSLSRVSSYIKGQLQPTPAAKEAAKLIAELEMLLLLIDPPSDKVMGMSVVLDSSLEPDDLKLVATVPR